MTDPDPDPGPETNDCHPADVMTGMLDHVLHAAETWPRWDGSLIDGDAFESDGFEDN
jgi:hypothetical protein